MLVVRKPSRETGLGRKSFVPCDRRGSGLHISQTRRRAENPLAAKKQFVRYSHPIVSQNQTKPGGAKTPVCTSNRKNSKCHLSRCVTSSYVDMRIRQPDRSKKTIVSFIPQKHLPATKRRSEVEVGSFLDSRRREGGPSGQGRQLPVSWTSNQFPPAEPSCKLNESQSKVRLWANSPLGCRAI